MKIDTGTLLSQQARLAQTAQELAASAEPTASSDQPAAGGEGFLSAFQQAVQNVDAQSQEASKRMAAVDSGQSDDLVGAMLASQQASLSFSLLMQVRNKVMGAVDELTKLQV